jgi:SMI1 / KNR4 family (SUKH-1)
MEYFRMAKKEKRPHVVPQAKTPVRRAEKLRFSEVGPKLRSRQFDIMEGRLTSFGLPDEYRTFLRKYNGGAPDPCTFDWVHPTEGRCVSHIDGLFGFDPRPLDDLNRGVDCFSVILLARSSLPRHSVPIGFVDDDNLLLIFDHGARHAQIWIKIMGEESMNEADPPDAEAGMYYVAKSLSKFLGLLYRGPDEES